MHAHTHTHTHTPVQVSGVCVQIGAGFWGVCPDECGFLGCVHLDMEILSYRACTFLLD
jgi:hypothetical protein